MKKKVIHAIAECGECNFKDENYLTAQKNGYKHYKNTGHDLVVEIGYTINYRNKKPE